LVCATYLLFELIAEIEAVRPERDAADGPDRIALALTLAYALVDEAVVELLEHELEVLGRIGRSLPVEPRVPVLVHPLEVHRIAGVLLALEPVARDFRDHDLAEAVLPGERLPDRQLGRRQRAHIGEQEPGAFLHRIGLGRATPRAVRIDDIVIGLLDDAAGLVHQPAVIIAADADLLDEAVGEVGTP